MSEFTLQESATTSYWTNKIKNAGGASFYNILPLPGHAKRQQYTLRFPAPLSAAVTHAAKDKDINIYKLAMAALYIVLGKYSQRPELLLTTGGVRIDEELPISDPALLFFAVSYEEEMSARELLKQIHLELEANIIQRDYDFSRLAAVLKEEQQEWAKYAFTTGFGYEPVTILQEELYQADIFFLFSRDEEGLTLQLDYNAALYEEVYLSLLGGHLLKTLEIISHDLSTPVGNINFITAGDHQFIHGSFNDTAVAFCEQAVIEQFEQQALFTPDSIAVKSGDVILTYRELNERANQVAYYLKQTRGLLHQDKVALMVNRSEKIIIGIIGILKAGGVYIPIDLSSPPERVRFFLEDSECAIVLTEKALIEQTPDAAALGYVAIDELTDERADNPVIQRDPHELAYMIYTSGTTGKPKGAMIHHLGLANHVSWFRKRFAITPADSTMLINSYSFDGCYSYIWATLTAGATLHVPNDSFFDPEKTLRYIKQEGITFLKMVPSTFGVLVNSATFDEDPLVCSSVRMIKQGGETINVKNLRKYLQRYPHAELGNHYGATESTIGSVAWWIREHSIDDFARQPVLGKPFDNQRVYILNSSNELLPVGVPGEICIGGVGVGKGYYNREELTARKFIDDPFSPGGKLYKTGDHGRWLPSGTLEFFGRIDNQVKIRGYRIELDEVAETLKAYPDVRDAIVLVYTKDGQDQLAAYIVTDNEPHIPALQEFMKGRLPEYMLPVYYIPLARIPLTPNGKIDKRALPDAGDYRPQFQGAAVAPRTATEALLLQIWETLLDISGVGVTDNFFEIGGHSLKATQLIAQIHKKMQVLLPLREVFLHATIEEQAVLVDASGKDGFADILPVGEQEDYSLSHAQQRMWLLAAMEEEQTSYNIPHAAVLEGNIDVDAFRNALDALVTRHEILRTVFVTKNGVPRQQVRTLADSGFTLVYKDLQSEPERENIAADIAAAEAGTVFDLEKGPLVRAVLLRISDNRYTFLFTLHHIISDGWSTQVFFSDILSLYYAFSKKETALPEPLHIQYKDFAAWQQELLSGAAGTKYRDYWLRKLGGERPVLELPADFIRPRVMTFNGDYISCHLPGDIQQKLLQYAAANNLSLYMVLMGAVKTLLYRYTGQQDLIVGTPVAGREHVSLANQIGCYVNTLAIRSKISNGASFNDFVKTDIRDSLLEGYQHQAYPFDQLIDDLQLERDMSRSPLFNVMVVMQNNNSTRNALLDMNELKAYPFNNQRPVSKFDLTIDFEETNEGLVLGIEYYTDLFAAPRINRMLEHLGNIIRAIADNPYELLDDIDYMTGEEQQEIRSFNGSFTPSSSATVHHVFEKIAAQYADAVALEDERSAWTYAQLNNRANQLAAALSPYAVREGVVAVVMSRGADFVTAMLAILKAGCAYLPIESQTPVGRITQLLEYTQAVAVITDDETILSHLESGAGVLYLPDIDLDANAAVTPELPVADGDSLAYVMFTSGTTGKPKGVMIEHHSIINLVRENPPSAITEKDRILQTGALSFDAATLEVWGALLNGARVIVMGLQHLLDPSSMAATLREKQVTLAFFTTSWLNQLIDHDPQMFMPLQHIYTGGEQVSVSHIRKLITQCPALRVMNLYGPTEITTYCTCTEMNGYGGGPVSIGQPIQNDLVLIVDRRGKPVPKGIPGEMLLGGAGLSRGYIQDEIRTAQQFITLAGDRFYKSGDQARWTENGGIEFIGRIDEQVKIRGYRVEPDEVATVLQSHPAVKEGIVIVHRKSNGDKILAGYYTLTETATRDEIKSYLGKLLPAYMVPDSLIILDRIPLNANGKTDRNALPEPQLITEAYQGARNETEQALVTIWERLLGVSPIGIYDNFFALGGHSLLATRLVSAIRSEMNRAVTVKELFIQQTIATLSPLLEAPAKEKLPAISRYTGKGKVPLSFAQERLWFIDQLEGSVQYHMPVLLRLKGTLDTAGLTYALREMIDRHEVLRTVILQEDGRGYQQTRDSDEWQLALTNDTAYSDPALLHAAVEEWVAAPFDLSADFMLRARLIKVAATEHVLLIVMHHIATDGWSMGIIIRELTELYNAYTTQRTAALPVLSVQYTDFAIWQRRHFSGEILDKQLQYWKHKLDEVTPLNLLTDYARPAIQSARGSYVSFHIDAALTAQLQELSRQQDATLFMTLLAAFKVLLHRYTGQDDISVGAPIAGRTQQEVEQLVGFFVNTLVLRSDLSGNPSFLQLLQQVKATTLEAYDHQDVPFEKVVDEVVVSRELSRSPLFQAVFALQNAPRANGMDLGGIQLSEEDIEQTTAKTDISFSMEETPEGLQGSVVYCADLFRQDTIVQLLAHFKQLLQAIATAPATTIGLLPLLSEGEKQQLQDFNKTIPGFDIPANTNILSVFAQQVALYPQNPALVYEDITLTYNELDRRSNRFAHYLRQLGVGPETLVPVCLERSPEMIIGIMGVLKAGAAYLPIDPAYPAERILYTLEDSGADILLSSKACEGLVNYPEHIRVIKADSDWDAISQTTDQPLEIPSVNNQLAYVIYTSGSTGKPKGVQLEHKGVVNMVQGQTVALRLKPGLRMLQFSSFGFDAFCYELFCMVLSGGCLVLPKREDLLSAEGFEAVVDRHQVELVVLPPSYQRAIREKTGTLHTIVSAGEALNTEDARYFKEKGIRLINAYGPTENTIIATYTDDPVKPHAVVIGVPVPNVQVYIADRYNNLCPIGVAGEICIGGDSLARGYLHRDDLNAEKFVGNIFNPGATGKCYRAGDLGRWLPDGSIEFLGRIDDQVKIRGYRIELGEINTVLLQSPLVREGIVVVHKNNRHKMRLIGYVVPEGPFDKDGILAYLKGQLPDYMVPSLLIEMAALPVTTSGKIDRRALPNPDETAFSESTYTAPRNETERELARIWQELLRVERVGIYDNFFELGGDSIITIQMVSRARRAGYLLHPRDLFLHQQIAALAGAVTTSREVITEQGILNGEAGLLPIQQWFFDQSFTEKDHFNQAILLNIDKALDVSKLNAVAAALAERHDALRCRYRREGDRWIQEYGYLLSGVTSEEATDETAITAICQHYQEQLDISAGKIWQCVLIKTPHSDAHHRLFIVIHHLAVDGVSWRIILEDLMIYLDAVTKGQVLQPASKTSSVRQWQQALCRYAIAPATVAELPYWKHIVNGYTPLPVSKDIKEVLRKETDTHTVLLSETATRHLLGKVQQVYNTGINDWLLASLAHTIGNWTGNNQVLITLEGHGREAIAPELDTTQTVGWFTNMYPVLLEVPDSASTALVRSVKEQLRMVPAKGMGYAALRYLHPDDAVRKSLHLPATDILFNYLGQLDNLLHADGDISLSDESTGDAVSGNNTFNSKLEITASVSGGQLYMSWTYSPDQYNPVAIAQLAQSNIALLEELIAVAAVQETAAPTPSDYGLSGLLSIQQLDNFQAAQQDGSLHQTQLRTLYQLGPLQSEMYRYSRSSVNAGTYIIQVGFEVSFPHIRLMKKAWEHVIARHSILRTAFHDVGGTPLQAVYSPVGLPFAELDYSGLTPAELEKALAAFLLKDKRTDFDMATPPLMRVTFIQLPGGNTRMVWTCHHIIMDGWSMPVVIDEWLSTCNALLKGDAISNGTVDQYEAFIRFHDTTDRHATAAFWKQHLKGITAPKWLPFADDRPDRNKLPGVFNDVRLVLDETITSDMQQFAQAHHITVNTLIQGVWATLLYRYNRNRKVVFGATVSTRPAEIDQVEQKVGPYINIIPVRADVTALPLGDWLRELQDTHSLSRSYQHAGLADIRTWTNIKDDLFDSVLFFENYPLGEVSEKEERQPEILHLEMNEHNNYLLSVFVGVGSELVVRFNYNSSLLSDVSVNIISGHFKTMLLQLLTNPDKPVTQFRLITPQQLKSAFEATGIGQRKRISLSATTSEKPRKSK